MVVAPNNQYRQDMDYGTLDHRYLLSGIEQVDYVCVKRL